MNFFKFQESSADTGCCFLNTQKVSRSGLKSSSDNNHQKHLVSRHGHRFPIERFLQQKTLLNGSLKQNTPKKGKLSLSKLSNERNSEMNEQFIKRSRINSTVSYKMDQQCKQGSQKFMVKNDKIFANFHAGKGLDSIPQLFLVNHSARMKETYENKQSLSIGKDFVSHDYMVNKSIGSDRNKNAKDFIRNSVGSLIEPSFSIRKTYEQTVSPNVQIHIPQLPLEQSYYQQTKQARTVAATVSTDRQMLVSQSEQKKILNNIKSSCKISYQKHDVSQSRLTESLGPILQKQNLKTTQSIYSSQIGVAKREVQESIILMDFFNPPQNLKCQFQNKMSNKGF